MKRITMLAMAIIIAGMFHANAAKGDFKIEKAWEVIPSDKGLGGPLYFSSTNKYVIASDVDNKIILDSETGKTIKSIPNNSVENLSNDIPRFICNDTIFSLLSKDLRTINFYCFDDMALVAHLDSADDRIVSYQVSQDNKYIVANVNPSKIVLWDLATKKIIKEKKIEKKYQNEDMCELSSGPVFIQGYDQFGVSITRSFLTDNWYKGRRCVLYYNSFIILNQNLDSVYTIKTDVYDNLYIRDRLPYIDTNIQFSPTGRYYIQRFDTITKYQIGVFLERKGVINVLEYPTKKIVSLLRPEEDISYDNINFILFSSNNRFLILSNNKQINIQSIRSGGNIASIDKGVEAGDYLKQNGDAIVCRDKRNVYKYKIHFGSGVDNSNSINSTYLSYPTPIRNDFFAFINVAVPSKINLLLSDERGKQIDILCDQYFEIGSHKIDYDISKLPNGLYFLTLTDDNGSHTQKIIIER